MRNTRIIAILLQRFYVILSLGIAAGNGTDALAADETNSKTNRAPAGMVLDLGEESSFSIITPTYSNAVLVALLPYFSDFVKKLDLPVPQPITLADVADFRVLPYRPVLSASLQLKNDCGLSFHFGYVNGFSSAQEVKFSNMASPDYGEIKTSRDDAVKTAKTMLKKLGIPPEDVYADREPKVTLPVINGGKVVYPYRIEWFGPFNDHSFDIKIDPHTGKIERIYLSSPNLVRPPPKIEVVPPFAPNSNNWFTSHIPPQKINPEYARQLVPIMFKAVDEYAEKLSLPISLPLTTNNVARVKIFNNGGWPHCEIWLTNGWQFLYRHAMVNGYYSPTVFNTKEYLPLRVKDFEGKWNLNTNQAIAIIKKALAKLNYQTNNIHMDFAPEIFYASGDFRKIIPRYSFAWNYLTNGDLQSKVEAEVNADTGKLESLYYDDKAYWNSRPPIDVPISFPLNAPNPQK